MIVNSVFTGLNSKNLLANKKPDVSKSDNVGTINSNSLPSFYYKPNLSFKSSRNETLIDKYTANLMSREQQLNVLKEDIQKIEQAGSKEEKGIASPLTLKKEDGSAVKVNLSRYEYTSGNFKKHLYVFKESETDNILGYCRIDGQPGEDENERPCLYGDDFLNLTEGNERVKGIGSIGLQIFIENGYLKGVKGNMELSAQRIVKDKQGRSESPFVFYLSKGFICDDSDQTASLIDIKNACSENDIDHIHMDKLIRTNNRLWAPKDVPMKLGGKGRQEWLEKIKANPILNETKARIANGTLG